MLFSVDQENQKAKKRFLPDWSIRTKLVLILLAVTVTPLCISSFLTYRYSLNTLEGEYINNNLKVIQQCSTNVSNYLEELNQLSLSPYKNNEFLKNASFDQTDFSGTQYNENFLKNMLFSRNDLTYLYYYIYDSQTLYSFSKQLFASSIFPDTEEEDWLKKTVEIPGGFYIGPNGRFINYLNIGSSDANETFTINRTIKDISNGKIFSVLSLVVDNRRLGDLCGSILSDNEEVALIDSSGGIYYSNFLHNDYLVELVKKNAWEKDSGYISSISVNGNSIIVYCKTYGGIILIKSIPYSIISDSSVKSLGTNIIIIIISALVVIALSILISYSISIPLKRLVNSMKKLGEGNFNLHISRTGNDEIGELASKFNEMAREINTLVNSEYKLKLAKKNAQLRALQAQINPHFMYNALQSVGTLAIRREAPEIYALTNAIANMLRYSLKSSGDLVNLYTEIENMNYYLYVQKVRFGNRLKVEVNIEDTAREYRVPRLILQPLVENSIKYGIDDEKQEETIIICAAKEGEFIVVTVKDTGRGIDPQRLDMIREWLAQEEDLPDGGSNLGIKNVKNRLKLIYGEKAEFVIDSRIDEGTSITIRLPVNNEWGENECTRPL